MTGRLLFVATEDWFVASHFQPMVARAISDGWRVTIAARKTGADRALSTLGAQFEPLEIGRSGIDPLALVADTAAIQRVIDKVNPDLVHAIAMKPATLAALTRGPPLILAITGLGWLSTSRALKDRFARHSALTLIGAAIRSGRAVGLFENRDDAHALGRLDPKRVFLAPGAGVDISRYSPASPPTFPPVRIGLVARMIRSKGVDLAVEAVGALRRAGVEVELILAGAPDPDNPGAIDAGQIETWCARGGIRWLGRIDDVPRFWEGMNVACLPSRGGEGLPRSLLEAAACGRPIVTTDVPGCRDFVRDGVEGRVVRNEDAQALASAISDLVARPDLRAAMGVAARARVEAGYTVGHVQDVAAQAWRAASLSRQVVESK